VVELNDRVVGPQQFLDLVARHDIPRALHQHSKNLEGLLLEAANFPVRAAEFTGLQVKFEGADPHACWRRADQLGHPKGGSLSPV
jgi:hypothetical protein